MNKIDKFSIINETLDAFDRDKKIKLSIKYSTSEIVISNIITEVLILIRNCEKISSLNFKCGQKAANILKEVFPTLKISFFPELDNLQIILEN